KDGSRVPVLVGGATFDERAGVDLTDRERADAAASESERRYHELHKELAQANVEIVRRPGRRTIC
ncbi:hypothetical protein, partial [Rhodoblastus sp.]|uniref:hypothetical protein n=1 Tax=Rhodoblastus sp. TaxID=1962975 RepID=UPI003F9974B8